MESITEKLCECGCGGVTLLATKTDKSTNRIKGMPMRFIHGHNTGKPLTIQRFMEHVKLTPTCWIWVGTKRSNGYGILSVNGRYEQAHRVAYTLLVGPITNGLWVLHNCPDGDNPACVNPAHLWLGTVLDNNRDMYAKGRNGDTGRRGEANNLAVLTEQQVREIRKLRQDTSMTYKAIGARFGVGYMAAYSIVKGLSWKHVK